MTAPETADGAPSAPTFSMTHRQILTILGGLMMGMLLAALDQTIVATAIRTIGDDLHARHGGSRRLRRPAVAATGRQPQTRP